MNQKKDITTEKSNNDIYDSAIQLLIYEGQMVWTILSVYLVVNTILLGFIAQIIITTPFFKYDFRCFIAGLFGLLLILPWVGTFMRNSDYYHFRMEQAKEVEPINWKLLVGRGEKFAEGKEVIVNGKKIKISWLGRLARNKRAGYFVVILFCILYLLIIIAFGPWWK